MLVAQGVQVSLLRSNHGFRPSAGFLVDPGG